MPTYEYACKECGQHIEVNQKFSDAPLTECPNCGGVLRKVFSAPAISFKGSGFYKNDHGSTSGSPKPASDSPAATPAASSESAKPAETKSSDATPAESSKPSSSTSD